MKTLKYFNKTKLTQTSFSKLSSKQYSSYFTADFIGPPLHLKKDKNDFKTNKNNLTPHLEKHAGPHPLVFKRQCESSNCLKYNCSNDKNKSRLPPCKLTSKEHSPSFITIKKTKVYITGHTTHGFPKVEKTKELYPLGFSDLDNNKQLINYVRYKTYISYNKNKLKINNIRSKNLQQYTERLNKMQEHPMSELKKHFLLKIKPKKLQYYSKFNKTKAIKYQTHRKWVKNHVNKAEHISDNNNENSSSLDS